jgi:hypothetical protein
MRERIKQQAQGIAAAPISQLNLTLLAPESHIGQTISPRPTFAWFVADQDSYPIEFILFEYGDNGKGDPIQRIKLQSKPGIMTLSLPPDKPLELGKSYVWQVSLICRGNSPSKNPWSQTVVEVVAPSANLKNALSSNTDPLKRAELLSEAGLWYDALAETLTTPQAKAFRQTLLTDLGALESPDRRGQLEKVAEYDRTH